MKMINERLLWIMEGQAKLAQEGPWVFSSSLDGRRGSVVAPDSKVICSYGPEDLGYAGTKHANFQFMANARNDVPFLVNEIRNMQKKLDIAIAALNKCGHTPLVPKAVWPTADEIWKDRSDRVTAAQDALKAIKE